MTKLLSPAPGALVPLARAYQKHFSRRSQSPDGRKSIDWLHLERSGNEDMTIPLPVRFRWESDSADNILELSEDEVFSAPRIYSVSGNTAEIYNFKADTVYYWRVNGSEPVSFRTEDITPVWYYAEGCSNIRDVGSWKTADGRRLRQGLFYRGTEMDTHHTVTPEGIRAMRKELGIRTDLDLRGEAVGVITESPLGSDITLALMPCLAYEYFMQEDQKPVCKALLEFLAEENNYPVYFHCWGGADRTGTLALIIEYICGVSEEDLYTDYELTSLSIWGERRRDEGWFPGFLEELRKYGTESESVPVKLGRFLGSCGVKEETLQSIRRIFGVI